MLFIRFGRFHYLQFLIVLLSIVFSSSFFSVYCQHVWKVQDSGIKKDLHSVTNGEGLFVAVGDDGTILTSSDALHWSIQKSGTTNTLYKVIYGKGQFVAVGENSIITSTNGTEWVAYQPVASHKHLRGISYGNDKYVAVAGFSGILTSTNGVNWVAQSPLDRNYSTSVNYGGNLFVATGGGMIKALSTADSGWTKTKYSFPKEGHSRRLIDFTDVAYGKGLFVAVGTKAVVTSSNGVNWTESVNETLPYFHSISYGSSQFVAVGFNGAINTSSDGISWTEQSSTTEKILYGIGAGKNKFVAVGEGGTILTSDIDHIASQLTSQVGIDSSTNLRLSAETLDQVLAYPNPSESGRFKLVLPKNALRFRVTSLQGVTVRDFTLPSSELEIDLSDLSSGMYILHVDTLVGSRVLKLIKR